MRLAGAAPCSSLSAAALELLLEGAPSGNAIREVGSKIKRQNIEVVLGFLDAIRRHEGDAAAEFLGPDVVWQGVVPELLCRSPAEVLGIFLGRRDAPIEIESLELIGAPWAAVFAVHRPERWEVAGVQIPGAMYHVVEIDHGRIMRIPDFADRTTALAAAGLGDD